MLQNFSMSIRKHVINHSYLVFHRLTKTGRGGPEFLLDQGGGDVTELFEDAGHSEEARSILKKLKIGVVEGKVRYRDSVFGSSGLNVTNPAGQ